VAESTKEAVKWIMGVIAALLLFSIKYSIDNNTAKANELKDKVDKVYDYTSNHEVRMAVIERELQIQGQKLLDIDMSIQKYGNLAQNRPKYSFVPSTGSGAKTD